jgi:hypothetical protein
MRFCLLGGKGIDNQPKTLVVGEPRRPGVSGKHRRLRRGGSEREPERCVPHSIQNVPDGCDTWDHVGSLLARGSLGRDGPDRVDAGGPPGGQGGGAHGDRGRGGGD